MVYIDTIFDMMKENGIRITNARKHFIEILYENHFTFDDLYTRLCAAGQTNLATLYNNIDFLLNHKVIGMTNVDGVTYYEIILGSEFHNSDSHIHFQCDKTHHIHEFNSKKFLDYLLKYPDFKTLTIDNFTLGITGSCSGECSYEKNKLCPSKSLEEILNNNK